MPWSFRAQDKVSPIRAHIGRPNLRIERRPAGEPARLIAGQADDNQLRRRTGKYLPREVCAIGGVANRNYACIQIQLAAIVGNGLHRGKRDP